MLELLYDPKQAHSLKFSSRPAARRALFHSGRFVLLAFTCYDTAQAYQSSTRAAGGAASRAIDGNKNNRFGGNSCTHTLGENKPYWFVDIGISRTVTGVRITNRGDCCCEYENYFEGRRLRMTNIETSK